jgi:hypothetical protein
VRAIEVEPFRLSTKTENEPSEFEIIFIHKNVLYFVMDLKRQLKELYLSGFIINQKQKKLNSFTEKEAPSILTNRSFTKGNTVVKEGLVQR